jgi:hypothetical protein
MNPKIKILWKKTHSTKRLWIKKAKRGIVIPHYIIIDHHPALKHRFERLGMRYLPHEDGWQII